MTKDKTIPPSDQLFCPARKSSLIYDRILDDELESIALCQYNYHHPGPHSFGADADPIEKWNITNQHRHYNINQGLRERSGKIDLEGRLIDFLYTLMRDHLPLADVEELVRTAEMDESANGGKGPNQYSNGWLALYAKDLAERLTQHA